MALTYVHENRLCSLSSLDIPVRRAYIIQIQIDIMHNSLILFIVTYSFSKAFFGRGIIGVSLCYALTSKSLHDANTPACPCVCLPNQNTKVHHITQQSQKRLLVCLSHGQGKERNQMDCSKSLVYVLADQPMLCDSHPSQPL